MKSSEMTASFSKLYPSFLTKETSTNASPEQLQKGQLNSKNSDPTLVLRVNKQNSDRKSSRKQEKAVKNRFEPR